MRVALVSCVGKKTAMPMPAKDLYISAWFTKARQYAERTCDAWYILSAKYGQVHPDMVLEPYEMTLNTMRQSDRWMWAVNTYYTLFHSVTPGSTLVFLAGARYREFLEKAVSDLYRIEVPMSGLGIGQQLKWLKEHTPCS